MMHTRRNLAASAALAIALFGAGLRAQTPAKFEVASVRPSKPGETQVTVSWTGGVTMINVPLRAIVQFAYGINTPSRIVGHPDWTNVERFDIQAKPPEGLTGVEQMRPMLQMLLADRFKMVARSEKREVQSYALIKAKPDGPLGPRLKPSTAKCTGGGVLTPAPASASNPDAVPCGVRPGGAGRVLLVGVPMAQLAPLISLVVQRPVVDRTGITGIFDIEMTFSPGAAPGGDLANPDAPSIFTALEEQLGLKLDAQREMVDVLVIEKIDRPSEN
jgi:uncharacterized protein (TIGR03435 family)